MSEIEKAQLRAKQAEERIFTLERNQQRRDIAEKIGLPLAFANRIQGDTPEAMEEDAKSLLEALPKKQAPAIPNGNPPANNGGETDAEKRKRLGLA